MLKFAQFLLARHNFILKKSKKKIFKFKNLTALILYTTSIGNFKTSDGKIESKQPKVSLFKLNYFTTHAYYYVYS